MTDAGARPDADEPDAGRDAGPPGCPSGQHRCGGGCIEDRPNVPEEGCRLGCGEPCPVLEGDTATCTEDGMCDVLSCTPATCETLGAMCGDQDDGCGGTVSCGTCEGGTECTDGMCGCTEDAGEPNDARTVPHTLPDFTDAPDTSMTFDAFNVSDAADEDWYFFHVADDFDGGNPQIRVTLDGIPTGSNYDLGVWYVCDSGGDGTSCSAGAPDNMIGRGCISESSGTTSETVELDTNCSGSGDDGNVYVRVIPRTWMAACTPYTLSVSVR